MRQFALKGLDRSRHCHTRPMHVSSRDPPQSLEFWEDGRPTLPFARISLGNHRRLSANCVVYGWAVTHPEPMNRPGLRTLNTADYWVLSKTPKIPHVMVQCKSDT